MPVLVLIIATGLAALGLASCASPHPTKPQTPAGTAPSKSSLPPRPATLLLNSVKPCDLLTKDQSGQLGTDFITSSSDNDGLGSADCLWSTSLATRKPNSRWLVRLNVKQGAELGLNPADPLVKVVDVDGFAAVQTYPQGSDGRTDCIEAIDVAPNQNLQVIYTNLAGDYPGIDHQVACQLADRVARLALANLRRLGS